ncbi:MAG: hypothetical protein HYS16_00520 [Deltaproteobacteria bacterium]|nr:MAG: hypothetical protein HYS16_00520 [Deltaproteobacteria bacterium]
MCQSGHGIFIQVFNIWKMMLFFKCRNRLIWITFFIAWLYIFLYLLLVPELLKNDMCNKRENEYYSILGENIYIRWNYLGLIKSGKVVYVDDINFKKERFNFLSAYYPLEKIVSFGVIKKKYYWVINSLGIVTRLAEGKQDLTLPIFDELFFFSDIHNFEFNEKILNVTSYGNDQLRMFTEKGTEFIVRANCSKVERELINDVIKFLNGYSFAFDFIYLDVNFLLNKIFVRFQQETDGDVDGRLSAK